VKPMSEALTRARRFRYRAQECQRLSETCHSAEMAKHYRIIAKHYLALARLEEDQIDASADHSAASLAPD
jgi:hypothetical protein